MISTTIDATAQFNANSVYNLDLSGWDYAVVQLTTPAGAVTFNGTNDAGAVQGVSDGNAYTAINWNTVQLINLSSGTAGTTGGATGSYKYSVGTRFLQLSGTTAGKVIVVLSQIS